jgi:dihydroorotase
LKGGRHAPAARHPGRAETVAIGARAGRGDRARVHFGRLSTRAAPNGRRRAAGLPVTADVAMHQLFLTRISARLQPACQSSDTLRAPRPDALPRGEGHHGASARTTSRTRPTPRSTLSLTEPGISAGAPARWRWLVADKLLTAGRVAA